MALSGPIHFGVGYFRPYLVSYSYLHLDPPLVGAYSPSITMAEQLNLYEAAFLNLTSRNVAHLNQSINMSNGTIGWYNSTLVSEVAALQKELDYLAEFPGYSPPVDIFM